MALFPAWALDLCDSLVDQLLCPVEIAELGHALGQHGFPIRIADSATAVLPAGHGPLQ